MLRNELEVSMLAIAKAKTMLAISSKLLSLLAIASMLTPYNEFIEFRTKPELAAH